MQHNCPHDSKCFDTPGIAIFSFGRFYLTLGGYECQCAEGFKKQGNFCIDLNECAVDGLFSCAPDSQAGFPVFSNMNNPNVMSENLA